MTFALTNGDGDIIRMLLTAGANPNMTPSVPTRRPFCLAVASDSVNVDTLALLLANGAHVEERDSRFSALECLRDPRRRREKAEFLVEHGADPNWVTASGQSLLAVYSSYGWGDVVEALRAKGAVNS